MGLEALVKGIASDFDATTRRVKGGHLDVFFDKPLWAADFRARMENVGVEVTGERISTAGKIVVRVKIDPRMTYYDIGHKGRPADVVPFYLLRGEQDIRYMKPGLEHSEGMHASWIHADVMGRIDPSSKRISVATVGPMSRVEYAVEILEMDYPDYEIWFFKSGSGAAGRRLKNPQVAGWLTPEGEFIPLTKGEHFHIAAKRLGMQATPKATRAAIKRGWVRLGDMTVQFSVQHKRRSLLMARDYYREVFADRAPDYDVMIEWNVAGEMMGPHYTIVSYRVPVAEFLEIEGVKDLARYPHQRIQTNTWDLDG